MDYGSAVASSGAAANVALIQPEELCNGHTQLVSLTILRCDFSREAAWNTLIEPARIVAEPVKLTTEN
jgi:hypothetical protein